MLKRITISLVKALPPNTKVWDTELRGFGVRRQSGSAVSYICKAQLHGRAHYFTIGSHGPWTPDAARKKARRILADPENARTTAETAKKVLTIAQVHERFMSTHGTKLKPRTIESYERAYRLYVGPAFGSTTITGILRTDISEKHAGWKQHPRAANLALSLLSKLMTWSEDVGYRSMGTNPVSRIARYREQKRERFLTRDELKNLGAALEKAEREDIIGLYALAAIRLLIFTGARRNEILSLTWTSVDFDRRMIFLCDSKTGMKPLALNDPAIAVLKSLPRIHQNPYVIVGHCDGSNLVNIQRPWNKIRKLAGLDGFRLHDLRHTYASIAVAEGGSLKVLGRQLGHQQSTTTDRYSHLNDSPVQELATATGNALAEAMGIAA